jgi:hypothetical protein
MCYFSWYSLFLNFQLVEVGGFLLMKLIINTKLEAELNITPSIKVLGYKNDENDQFFDFDNDNVYEEFRCDFKYIDIESIKIEDIPNDIILSISRKDPSEKWSPVDDLSPFRSISFIKTSSSFKILVRGESREDYNKIYDFNNLLKELEKKKIYKNINVSVNSSHPIGEGSHNIESEMTMTGTIKDQYESFIYDFTEMIKMTEEEILGYRKFQAALSVWEENKVLKKDDEDFWQDEFTKNPWILTNCLGTAVFLFQDKAYVGGTSINKKGAKITDYLFKNHLGNIVIVEIKTPNTPIISKSDYRGNKTIAHDLVGSVNQVLKYRDEITKSFYQLRYQEERKTGRKFEVYNPRCVLIIGSKEQFEDDSIESFELFRNELNNIDIVTFEELYTRLGTLYNIIKGD